MVELYKDGHYCLVYTDDIELVGKLSKAFKLAGATYEEPVYKKLRNGSSVFKNYKEVGHSWNMEIITATKILNKLDIRFVKK
jgi:hypothetical protein